MIISPNDICFPPDWCTFYMIACRTGKAARPAFVTLEQKSSHVIHDGGHDPGHYALEDHDAHGADGGVHLPADGCNGGHTRGVQEREYQEAYRGQRGKQVADGSGDAGGAGAEQYA